MMILKYEAYHVAPQARDFGFAELARVVVFDEQTTGGRPVE
jgi:hypothetical protein